MNLTEKYESVIGLEVHAQLLTETKAFCGCSTKFGAPPNTNICPVCLGYPGVLPVLNKKVVEFTVLMGLATNCVINKKSIFARKNYFYPDLPKGYQISQFEEPICENGFMNITQKNGDTKKIRINRIHMEEDAGKSIHDQGFDTLVDLNRCGVPLIEIVSEPDIRSPYEAYQYLLNIKKIVTYLGICDGNMEEGSLRCDANISIRLRGSEKLGTRTEVKNMNSFHNVEKALQFEIERQIDMLEDGAEIVQETLLWNADLNEAVSMRSKEESHDYRYFPDPDLMPVIVNEEWKNEIRQKLPELPDAKKTRLIKEFNLPEYDAEVLTSTRELAEYFEAVTKVTDDYKAVSNWIMGEVLKIVNEEKINISAFPVSPENLGRLINLIKDKTISGKIAKKIFPEMLATNKEPALILKEKNLIQITDAGKLGEIINMIFENNPTQVQQYLSGKEKILGYFVGQIMKETRGQANPEVVNKLLHAKLNEMKANSTT